jgi:hypothetical protein
MKNKFVMLSLLFAFSLTACSKKNKKQFSTWTVNGAYFSSNEVIATIEKAQSGLSTNDINNRFLLAFSISELPKSGAFELNTSTPGQTCVINFYAYGKFYYSSPSQIGKIQASEVNKKARYTLSPAWFVSYENPATDSVLISGTFNEP